MGVLVSAIIVAAALAAIYFVWRGQLALKRAEFIRTYPLPKGLFEKLMQKHPTLASKDCSLVARGLRHFFLAYLGSGRQPVSMPSQVVDDLWHEFILHTREYQRFCSRAFGGFFHHTPAVAMGKVESADVGLRRVWWRCCKEEHINPRKPLRLPLLFALDAKLAIAGGFVYMADCASVRRVAGAPSEQGAAYCGGELGSGPAGGCSGTTGTSADGLFSGDGVFGSSDGGSSGCGGGGCGGSD
jgi:hypothetical protein